MQHCKACRVAVLCVRGLTRVALVVMMNNAFALFIYSNLDVQLGVRYYY